MAQARERTCIWVVTFGRSAENRSAWIGRIAWLSRVKGQGRGGLLTTGRVDRVGSGHNFNRFVRLVALGLSKLITESGRMVWSVLSFWVRHVHQVGQVSSGRPGWSVRLIQSGALVGLVTTSLILTEAIRTQLVSFEMTSFWIQLIVFETAEFRLQLVVFKIAWISNTISVLEIHLVSYYYLYSYSKWLADIYDYSRQHYFVTGSSANNGIVTERKTHNKQDCICSTETAAILHLLRQTNCWSAFHLFYHV